MVVIVPETDVDEYTNITKHEKSMESNEESMIEEAENYETASDGEDSATVEQAETSKDTASDGEDSATVEQADPLKDGSLESALREEQLKQKALAQADDIKDDGNKLFGAGQYEDALLKYEYALYLAPDTPSAADTRSKCHVNRAICFSKLEKYEDTIKECTKALELNSEYMKALVKRGDAHEKLEHFEEAIADMKKILELDPSNIQAQRTIRRLEPLAIEKREKMKEEMIGKLKEMGNSILGRFGMSVDNFKTVKDPNTGSYSIQFQQ